MQFEPSQQLDPSSLPFASQWILSRLSGATTTIVATMHAYDFGAATHAAYSFWQYDLCDVFIELSKAAFSLEDGQEGAAAAKRATRDALWTCLETGLRLLHPFMPFVTEELWQRLPRSAAAAAAQATASIMVAPYPTPQPAWDSPQVEADMAYLQQVVNRTRGLRSDYGLNKERPPMYLGVKDAARGALLATQAADIAHLSTCASVEVLGEGQAAPHGCGVAILDDVTTVYLGLAGILDVAKELEKLQKKAVDIEGKIEALRRKVGMPSYADKTPEDVKAGDAEKLGKLQGELQAARHHMEDMKQLAA